MGKIRVRRVCEHLRLIEHQKQSLFGVIEAPQQIAQLGSCDDRIINELRFQGSFRKSGELGGGLDPLEGSL